MCFKQGWSSTCSSPEVRNFNPWLDVKQLFDRSGVSVVLLYLCDQFELIWDLVVIKHICLFYGVLHLFLRRCLHHQTTFGHISLGYCCLRWRCMLLLLLSIVVIVEWWGVGMVVRRLREDCLSETWLCLWRSLRRSTLSVINCYGLHPDVNQSIMHLQRRCLFLQLFNLNL